ncbi:hypothetical protein JRC49_10690 [Clostridiales bacterium FE2011]|nr:hypothetical protein JRC49_10690 [Clostridiales bacterium FE2011]
MMRRMLILFMALIMVCSVCLGEAADADAGTGAAEAAAEAMADAAEEDERLASFESWQTRIGNVTVALPGIPTACNPEGDWEGYWKNSLYVWGNCVHDQNGHRGQSPVSIFRQKEQSSGLFRSDKWRPEKENRKRRCAG